MRKAFGAILATMSAEARHPFVGEHMHAKIIDNGNGSHTMRMNARAAPYNKYESMLVRDDSLFKGRRASSTNQNYGDIYDYINEFIYGK